MLEQEGKLDFELVPQKCTLQDAAYLQVDELVQKTFAKVRAFSTTPHTNKQTRVKRWEKKRERGCAKSLFLKTQKIYIVEISWNTEVKPVRFGKFHACLIWMARANDVVAQLGNRWRATFLPSQGDDQTCHGPTSRNGPEFGCVSGTDGLNSWLSICIQNSKAIDSWDNLWKQILWRS